MSTESVVSYNDLPALYRDCDQGAVRTRKLYFCVLSMSLLFTALPEVIDAFKEAFGNVLPPESSGIILGGDFVAVAIAAFSTVLLFAQRLDKQWFTYRNAAEYLCRLSWRYMMRSGEFSESDKVSDERFRQHLAEVIHSKGENVNLLSSTESVGEQISDKMRQLRSSSVVDRMNVYRHDRVEEQISYYRRKARKSEKESRVWLALIFLFQMLTLAAVFLHAEAHTQVHSAEHVSHVQVPNLVGCFIAVGIFCIGWMQANKFGELALSCSASAHHLSLLLSNTSEPISEEELQEFVHGAEHIMQSEQKVFFARGAG